MNAPEFIQTDALSFLADSDSQIDVDCTSEPEDSRASELGLLKRYAGAVGNENFDEVMEHGQRTAETAVAIAKTMGLSHDEVNVLAASAFTHDVGKILVPTAIQIKPGPLSPVEHSTIRNHTWFGKILLEGTSSKVDGYDTRKVRAQVALLHHERWDGNGYPLRLKGTAIPLFAQITAVADVFDALLSERCYKRAWSLDRVLSTLLQERGRQFAPACIDALLLSEERRA